mmetsp:Transcript_97769/g.187441  ORF Transcript_97769/g.187441 Transcript_97769/m.187441 type:complete len:270 (-) Transcript_97769:60-869(-)
MNWVTVIIVLSTLALCRRQGQGFKVTAEFGQIKLAFNATDWSAPGQHGLGVQEHVAAQAEAHGAGRWGEIAMSALWEELVRYVPLQVDVGRLYVQIGEQQSLQLMNASWKNLTQANCLAFVNLSVADYAFEDQSAPCLRIDAAQNNKKEIGRLDVVWTLYALAAFYLANLHGVEALDQNVQHYFQTLVDAIEVRDASQEDTGEVKTDFGKSAVFIEPHFPAELPFIVFPNPRRFVGFSKEKRFNTISEILRAAQLQFNSDKNELWYNQL